MSAVLQVRAREPLGRLREPRIDERQLQIAFADALQLDEHGGIAVEMLDREEPGTALGQHRLLLVEVLDGHGEDVAVGRRLVAESLDVRLAERSLPRECLGADEPGAAAESRRLGHVGQGRHDRLDVLEGRAHDSTVRSAIITDVRRAFAAVAIVALMNACGNDAQQARPREPEARMSSSTTATSTTTTTAPLPGRLVAKTTQSIDVFDYLGPRPSSRVLQPGISGTLVLLVRTIVGTSWLEVELPVKPNGSVGYIRRADVGLTRNTYAIDLELGARLLTVRKLDAVLFQTQVAVGKPATPTPSGRFYITELLRSPNPAGDYGPYIYALSGYSPTLEQFNGKDAIIGIHGTDEPASIGTDASHGCVRLRNEDVTRLVEEIGLPLGTPVTIV
jgi:hypothetical protein